MEPVNLPKEEPQVQHVAVPLSDMTALNFLNMIDQKRCRVAHFDGHCAVEGEALVVLGNANTSAKCA
jgi:hypothetical protein